MKVRLAHASDIHFGCEDAAAVRGVGDWLARERPDALLVTGDITQSGRRREFRSAQAWLQAAPTPVICTPGNHDTPYWNLVARLIWPFRRYGDFVGLDWPAVLIGPGFAAAAINTARGAQPRANWSKGQIRRADVAAACRLLAGAGDVLKVAIVHHPLMEVTGGPMTGRVWGGAQAARTLAEGGADLILSGHVHTPFAHALPFADSRTYAVGASTLSLRRRGHPPGFNLIEADEEQISVTALAWTGRSFESERAWGFERRSTKTPARQLSA